VRLEQIKRQSTRLQGHILSSPVQNTTKLETVTPSKDLSTKIPRSQSFRHSTSIEITDNKVTVCVSSDDPTLPTAISSTTILASTYNRERSEKIKTLRKTDSFASAPSNNRNAVLMQPAVVNHRRKKSSGKVQEEINEFVRISIWMQNQEKERAQKGATEKVYQIRAR
jgi:hypothetical protein